MNDFVLPNPSGYFCNGNVRFIRHGEVKVITARDMNAWGKT
jgi:hypothetical protein